MDISISDHLENLKRKFIDTYSLGIEDGRAYTEALLGAVKECLLYDLRITLERRPKDEKDFIRLCFYSEPNKETGYNNEWIFIVYTKNYVLCCMIVFGSHTW